MQNLISAFFYAKNLLKKFYERAMINHKTGKNIVLERNQNTLENIKILGTIHKLHNENLNYTFNHIREAIMEFEPDIIAIEIRNRDINEKNEYLIDYYPPEMIQIKKEFENRIAVVGFDWRGEDLENEPIEKWIPSKADLSKYEDISNLMKKRKKIMNDFYKTCSIYECQDKSKLQELELIEKKLNVVLLGYGQEKLIQYKKDRESIMGNNILKIIKDNDGKKVMVITGITHVLYLYDRLLCLRKNMNI